MWVVGVPSPTTYAALHSSYHFGEPSLIPKLLLPCAYDIYYDYAVLLLISLLLRALCNLCWNEAL